MTKIQLKMLRTKTKEMILYNKQRIIKIGTMNLHLNAMYL